MKLCIVSGIVLAYRTKKDWISPFLSGFSPFKTKTLWHYVLNLEGMNCNLYHVDMKNLFTFFLLSLITFSLSTAQSLDIDLVTNTHNGGYHVSCFGGNDATVSSVVTGGTAPYAYSWSNGSNTADIVNIAAGNYTLTVTDSLGLSNTATIVLTQPTKLSVNISSYRYPGDTDISTNGASDGRLGADVSGGTPPYTYIWSTTDGTPQVNGNTNDKLNAVKAGTYSVVVTDANGCAYSAAYTMTEPAPLVATLNAPMTGGSWNLSCNGGADGSIDLTVTGGIPPYRFDWSHGEFSEDVSELRAGEYTVRITDQNEAEIQETITLTEPTALTVALDQNLYPNNYHVSCHDCYNGAATLTLTGGASGYSILWPDGSTNATRNDLGLDEYMVRMTDANGCEATELVRLMIPERDDWTMQGNAIGPQQFIGSTNAADVEFRANNQPQLRLGSDGVTELLGGLKTTGLEDLVATPIDLETELRYVFFDPVTQKIGIGGNIGLYPWQHEVNQGCWGSTQPNLIGAWSYGIDKIFSCPQVNVGIGTQDPTTKLVVMGKATIYDDIIAEARVLADGMVSGESLHAESLHLNAGSDELELTSSGLLTTGPWSQEGDDATLYLGNHSHFIRSMPFEGIQIGVPNVQNALSISDWSGNVSTANDLTVGNDLEVANKARIGSETVLSGPHSNFSLSVDGKIVAREMVVTTDPNWWADYVFEEDYPLRSIEEVAAYITEYGHLPDVPSTKEVVQNGQNLAIMNAILLRKIEELTLYLIEMNRVLETLK